MLFVHVYYGLASLKALCDLLIIRGLVPARMALPCIRGRILLTTVKDPSVDPILRSPQNYRIL